ncbi:hypothetical protein BDM02DRAFT_1193822 [Thelephora ganbajun]|uniref:Uncharacterized protein n=1 Tax=Thelephora ganbajun TaxID=370292 RepID=A0ACB6ZWN2_THEGA|nr:hypothetical protein BDM02DRAFT_1193822 [Thelephora ganbajun]
MIVSLKGSNKRIRMLTRSFGRRGSECRYYMFARSGWCRFAGSVSPRPELLPIARARKLEISARPKINAATPGSHLPTGKESSGDVIPPRVTGVKNPRSG